MLAHLYELGAYSLGETGHWEEDRSRIPEFLHVQTQWSF